jgi:Transposase DDE domain
MPYSCACDPEAAARELDVIVDSCSVRAKHGGELTGPNPTDRGKRGTKYHVVVSDDGLPLGASAANVHDTRMFPELLRLALMVGVRIARLLADAGYDSADNRWLCLRQGIQPLIRKIGSDHGSGLGVVRSVVENANAWLLNNKRLDRRHDRSASIIQSLLTTACIFVIANRLADL